MHNYDDLLERKLKALENGLPLERVLADFPEDAKELEQLLRLAKAIRTLPHPQPVGELARQALERVAAREKTRPIAYPRSLSPQPRILSPQPRTLWPSRRLGLAVGFAAAMLVVLLTFTAFFGLGSQRARAATAMDVTGVVRVASGNVEGKWLPAEDGLRVAGRRVPVRISLTLVFYDGSRMTVGLSCVTLDGLAADRVHLAPGSTQHR
jgi:hypothetical protein